MTADRPRPAATTLAAAGVLLGLDLDGGPTVRAVTGGVVALLTLTATIVAVGVAARRGWAREAAGFLAVAFAVVAIPLSIGGLRSDPPAPQAWEGLGRAWRTSPWSGSCWRPARQRTSHAPSTGARSGAVAAARSDVADGVDPARWRQPGQPRASSTACAALRAAISTGSHTGANGGA